MHVDIRDDRLIVFANVPSGRRFYRYIARAVTPGEFALPPVKAECMYDESITSVNGAGRLEVAK